MTEALEYKVLQKSQAVCFIPFSVFGVKAWFQLVQLFE